MRPLLSLGSLVLLASLLPAAHAYSVACGTCAPPSPLVVPAGTYSAQNVDVTGACPANCEIVVANVQTDGGRLSIASLGSNNKLTISGSTITGNIEVTAAASVDRIEIAHTRVVNGMLVFSSINGANALVVRDSRVEKSSAALVQCLTVTGGFANVAAVDFLRNSFDCRSTANSAYFLLNTVDWSDIGTVTFQANEAVVNGAVGVSAFLEFGGGSTFRRVTNSIRFVSNVVSVTSGNSDARVWYAPVAVVDVAAISLSNETWTVIATSRMAAGLYAPAGFQNVGRLTVTTSALSSTGAYVSDSCIYVNGMTGDLTVTSSSLSITSTYSATVGTQYNIYAAYGSAGNNARVLLTGNTMTTTTAAGEIGNVYLNVATGSSLASIDIVHDTYTATSPGIRSGIYNVMTPRLNVSDRFQVANSVLRATGPFTTAGVTAPLDTTFGVSAVVSFVNNAVQATSTSTQFAYCYDLRKVHDVYGATPLTWTNETCTASAINGHARGVNLGDTAGVINLASGVLFTGGSFTVSLSSGNTATALLHTSASLTTGLGPVTVRDVTMSVSAPALARGILLDFVDASPAMLLTVDGCTVTSTATGGTSAHNIYTGTWTNVAGILVAGSTLKAVSSSSEAQNVYASQRITSVGTAGITYRNTFFWAEVASGNYAANIYYYRGLTSTHNELIDNCTLHATITAAGAGSYAAGVMWTTTGTVGSFTVRDSRFTHRSYGYAYGLMDLNGVIATSYLFERNLFYTATTATTAYNLNLVAVDAVGMTGFIFRNNVATVTATSTCASVQFQRAITASPTAWFDFSGNTLTTTMSGDSLGYNVVFRFGATTIAGVRFTNEIYTGTNSYANIHFAGDTVGIGAMSVTDSILTSVHSGVSDSFNFYLYMFQGGPISVLRVNMVARAPATYRAVNFFQSGGTTSAYGEVTFVDSNLLAADGRYLSNVYLWRMVSVAALKLIRTTATMQTAAALSSGWNIELSRAAAGLGSFQQLALLNSKLVAQLDSTCANIAIGGGTVGSLSINSSSLVSMSTSAASSSVSAAVANTVFGEFIVSNSSVEAFSSPTGSSANAIYLGNPTNFVLRRLYMEDSNITATRLFPTGANVAEGLYVYASGVDSIVVVGTVFLSSSGWQHANNLLLYVTGTSPTTSFVWISATHFYGFTRDLYTCNVKIFQLANFSEFLIDNSVMEVYSGRNEAYNVWFTAGWGTFHLAGTRALTFRNNSMYAEVVATVAMNIHHYSPTDGAGMIETIENCNLTSYTGVSVSLGYLIGNQYARLDRLIIRDNVFSQTSGGSTATNTQESEGLILTSFLLVERNVMTAIAGTSTAYAGRGPGRGTHAPSAMQNAAPRTVRDNVGSTLCLGTGGYCYNWVLESMWENSVSTAFKFSGNQWTVSRPNNAASNANYYWGPSVADLGLLSFENEVLSATSLATSTSNIMFATAVTSVRQVIVRNVTAFTNVASVGSNLYFATAVSQCGSILVENCRFDSTASSNGYANIHFVSTVDLQELVVNGTTRLNFQNGMGGLFVNTVTNMTKGIFLDQVTISAARTISDTTVIRGITLQTVNRLAKFSLRRSSVTVTSHQCAEGVAVGSSAITGVGMLGPIHINDTFIATRQHVLSTAGWMNGVYVGCCFAEAPGLALDGVTVDMYHGSAAPQKSVQVVGGAYVGTILFARSTLAATVSLADWIALSFVDRIAFVDTSLHFAVPVSTQRNVYTATPVSYVNRFEFTNTTMVATGSVAATNVHLYGAFSHVGQLVFTDCDMTATSTGGAANNVLATAVLNNVSSVTVMGGTAGATAAGVKATNVALDSGCSVGTTIRVDGGAVLTATAADGASNIRSSGALVAATIATAAGSLTATATGVGQAVNVWTATAFGGAIEVVGTTITAQAPSGTTARGVVIPTAATLSELSITAGAAVTSSGCGPSNVWFDGSATVATFRVADSTLVATHSCGAAASNVYTPVASGLSGTGAFEVSNAVLTVTATGAVDAQQVFGGTLNLYPNVLWSHVTAHATSNAGAAKGGINLGTGFSNVAAVTMQHGATTSLSATGAAQSCRVGRLSSVGDLVLTSMTLTADAPGSTAQNVVFQGNTNNAARIRFVASTFTARGNSAQNVRSSLVADPFDASITVLNCALVTSGTGAIEATANILFLQNLAVNPATMWLFADTTLQATHTGSGGGVALNNLQFRDFAATLELRRVTAAATATNTASNVHAACFTGIGGAVAPSAKLLVVDSVLTAANDGAVPALASGIFTSIDVGDGARFDIVRSTVAARSAAGPARGVWLSSATPSTTPQRPPAVALSRAWVSASSAAAGAICVHTAAPTDVTAHRSRLTFGGAASGATPNAAAWHTLPTPTQSGHYLNITFTVVESNGAADDGYFKVGTSAVAMANATTFVGFSEFRRVGTTPHSLPVFLPGGTNGGSVAFSLQCNTFEGEKMNATFKGALTLPVPPSYNTWCPLPTTTYTLSRSRSVAPTPTHTATPTYTATPSIGGGLDVWPAGSTVAVVAVNATTITVAVTLPTGHPVPTHLPALTATTRPATVNTAVTSIGAPVATATAAGHVVLRFTFPYAPPPLATAHALHFAQPTGPVWGFSPGAPSGLAVALARCENASRSETAADCAPPTDAGWGAMNLTGVVPCGACRAAETCGRRRHCDWNASAANGRGNANGECRCRTDLGTQFTVGFVAPATPAAAMLLHNFAVHRTGQPTPVFAAAVVPIPWLEAAVLSADDYAFHLHVAAHGPSPLRSLTVTVRLDPNASRVTPPLRAWPGAPATTACVGADASNSSVSCGTPAALAPSDAVLPPNANGRLLRRRQTTVGASSAPAASTSRGTALEVAGTAATVPVWATGASATATAWLTAPLLALVEVDATNAPPLRFAVALRRDANPPDPATGTATVLTVVIVPTAPGAAGANSTDPLAGEAGPSGVDATAAPTTQAPPAGAVVGRGLRNIFTLGSGCPGGAMPHWLPLLVAALLAVMLGRFFHAVYAVRRLGPDALNRCRTHDAPAAVALPREHAWIGLVSPCHPHCGTVHTSLFLCQAMLLHAFAAVFLSEFFHGGSVDLSAAVVVGMGAAMLSAVLTAPAAMLFKLSSATDGRQAPVATADVPPQDLVSFGARRHHAAIGPVTLARLRRLSRHGAGVDATIADDAAANASSGGAGSSRRPKSVAVARAIERQCAADGRACPPNPNPDEVLTVVAASPQRLGHAVAAGVAAVGFLVAWFLTQPWCDDRLRGYGLVVAVGAVADVFVVQPLRVLCVYLAAWLDEDSHPEDDDDEESRAQESGSSSSETLAVPSAKNADAAAGPVANAQRRRAALAFRLHPIHGQRLYVGPVGCEVDTAAVPVVYESEDSNGRPPGAVRPSKIRGDGLPVVEFRATILEPSIELSGSDDDDGGPHGPRGRHGGGVALGALDEAALDDSSVLDPDDL